MMQGDLFGDAEVTRPRLAPPLSMSRIPPLFTVRCHVAMWYWIHRDPCSLLYRAWKVRSEHAGQGLDS